MAEKLEFGSLVPAGKLCPGGQSSSPQTATKLTGNVANNNKCRA